MRKRIIALIGVLAIVSAIFLSGCSQSGSETGTEASTKAVSVAEASKETVTETIGIIGAMDVEVTSLKESAEITKSTKIAEMDFCEGKLGEKNVVIVKCGMGKMCQYSSLHGRKFITEKK